MRKCNNQKAVGDSSLSRRRGRGKVQFRTILTNLKHPVRAERNFSQTPKSSQPAPDLSLGRETGTNWECRNDVFPCKGDGVFPFEEKHHFFISSIPSLAHSPSQCGAFKHRKLRGKEPMEKGQDCSENRDLIGKSQGRGSSAQDTQGVEPALALEHNPAGIAHRNTQSSSLCIQRRKFRASWELCHHLFSFL